MKTVEPELEPITNAFPPPKIQRQQTLIEPDPKSFQAILSKEPHTEKNFNNEVSKETLKVPVTDIFPEKLTEQNYSRRKKTGASTAVADTAGQILRHYFDFEKNIILARKNSPTRKLSSCLEPHEPVIDSLPAPVPLNPSPR